MIDIALVCSDELLRRGIDAMVREDDEFEVVASVASLDDWHPSDQFSRVLLLICICEMDDCIAAAIQAVRGSYPNVAFMVLVSKGRPSLGRRIDELGASVIVRGNATQGEMLAAMKVAATGRLVIDRIVGAECNSDEPADANCEPASAAGLTRRENEVLRLIGLGMSNREIAEELTLAVSTVKSHVENILRKLSVTRRFEAALVSRSTVEMTHESVNATKT